MKIEFSQESIDEEKKIVRSRSNLLFIKVLYQKIGKIYL